MENVNEMLGKMRELVTLLCAGLFLMSALTICGAEPPTLDEEALAEWYSTDWSFLIYLFLGSGGILALILTYEGLVLRKK